MLKGARTLENGWLGVCRLSGVPPLTTTASALSASPPYTLAVPALYGEQYIMRWASRRGL